MRRPGIKPGSRPWQGRILSLYYRRFPMEYLGFDPSTSSLLRTHASDCANTPHSPKTKMENVSKKGNLKRNKRGEDPLDAKVRAPRLELGISCV